MRFFKSKKKKKSGIDSNNYLQKLTEVLENIDSKPAGDILPDLKALYSFDKKDIVVLKALTYIHYRLKNYTKAFHYVLRALDIDPEDEMALKYKALLYYETHDENNYLKTLDQLIAVETDDFEVYDQFAEYLENKGSVLNALGNYTLALSCNENLHHAIHAAIGGANCYGKMGAYGIADEIYDMILLEFPKDKYGLYGKAYIKYLSNHINSSAKICDLLLSRDPNFKEANELLQLLNKKGE